MWPIAIGKCRTVACRKKPLANSLFSTRLSSFSFVLKGEFEPGTISLNLTIFDNYVLLDHFGYAQLPEMFCSLLNHILGSVFPTRTAGADESDNIICARGTKNLIGHRKVSSPLLLH